MATNFDYDTAPAFGSPQWMAVIVRDFERSLGASDPPASIPVTDRCGPCGGWGRWDDIPCSSCDGSGIATDAPGFVVAPTGYAPGLAAHGTAMMRQEARAVAPAAEDAATTLARFVRWMAANRYTIGEFGKSEGGGSPLTPVYGTEDVIAAYLSSK